MLVKMKRAQLVLFVGLIVLVLSGLSLPEVAANTNVPAQPTNVEAVSISDSEVFVQWDWPEDEQWIEEYVVYANGIEVGRTAVNVFRATDLSPATTYSFTVAASSLDQQLSVLSAADQAITFASANKRIVDASGGGQYTSLQLALNTASAGMLIEIRSGEYDWFRITAAGNSDQAITIRAAEGADVTIKGQSQLVGSYLWVEDLTFDGALETGFRNTAAVRIDGVYTSVVNNHIKNFAGSGVAFRAGASHAYVADNHIENVSTGVTASVDHLIIENNEIENLNLNGYSGAGDYFRVLGSYHIYRNNYTHSTLEENIGQMHADVFQTYDDNQQQARYILIEKHRHEGWVHQAIMMENDRYGPNGVFHASDWTIRNSTFIGYTTWAIAAGKAGGGIPNMVVENNVFIGDDAYYGVMMVGTNASGVVRNNIFMNHNNASVGAMNGGTIDADYNMFYNTALPSAPGEHDIFGLNPQFIDPQNGDFRLLSHSPAIDSGEARPSFNNDKDGNLRPAGSAWDIGAFEFQGTPAAIPPIVTITSPVQGAAYEPDALVSLQASARDFRTDIEKVTFYVNGVQVAEATTPPYSALYLPAAEGNYSVTAVVYNTDAQSATSFPVDFIVSSNPLLTANHDMHRNYAITPQTDTFHASFDIIPSANPMDGVIAFTPAGVSRYADMSAILRMNSNGYFDAWNGTTYTALEELAYESGQTYHVVFAVNVPFNMYSVYLTPEGGERITLAEGFKFRTPGVNQLANLATYTENNSYLHTAPDFSTVADIPIPGVETAGGIGELLDLTESYLQENAADLIYRQSLSGSLETALQAMQQYLLLLELAHDDEVLTPAQYEDLQQRAEALLD